MKKLLKTTALLALAVCISGRAFAGAKKESGGGG
jgi:hypothetical protein